MTDRRQTGIDGEQCGADFLTARGYTILERNYRTPYGELDIVARDGGVLVFVEVKRRRTPAFGRPQEAVGRRKQEHLVRSALHFIKAQRLTGSPLRFEVLAVGPGERDIELVSPAFETEGYTY